MYCDSPYNLNFESEIVSRFSWNSSSDSIEIPGSDALIVPALGQVTNDNAAGKRIRVSEPKTVAALKSHSDAERRRRERINSHLETLRGLLPNKEKIDKATLLAKVIKQVKQLRTNAKQAAEGLLIPMDSDDIQVEILDNINDPFLLRASLCCDQSPELLPGLRKAIKEIPDVRVLKCEVSTLDGRVKSVFLITSGGLADREVIANNVRAALCNILDKVSASAEFAQPLSFPRKRQRGSYVRLDGEGL